MEFEGDGDRVLVVQIEDSSFGSWVVDFASLRE